MAIAPFGDQFILDTPTYGSRTSDFISRPVNYFITGFKPGFALQASELNELQEQFYVQQTLSNRCIFNWLSDTTVSRKPFWEGCTPLATNLVSITNNTNSITFTFSAGWYYLNDKTYTSENIKVNSGFGIWIYNSQATSTTIEKTSVQASSNPSKLGFVYVKDYISSSDDETLNDNANSTNVLMSVPGADRIQIKNLGAAVYSTQTLFSEICNISRSGTSAAPVYSIKYGDGSLLQTING